MPDTINENAGARERPLMVSARDIHKSFGSLEVLKGVSLSLRKGDVTAVIGPSGSGKSTDRKSTRLNSSH